MCPVLFIPEGWAGRIFTYRVQIMSNAPLIHTDQQLIVFVGYPQAKTVGDFDKGTILTYK